VEAYTEDLDTATPTDEFLFHVFAESAALSYAPRTTFTGTEV